MTDNLSPNDKLLALMEARERREAAIWAKQQEEELKKELDYEAKVNRRKSGDQYHQQQLEIRMSRCDHRKGTTGKKKFKVLDYMLSRYTFQNGVMRIKCDKCKMRWFPGDTDLLCAGTIENYLKKIRKIANPTKLSYAQAWTLSSDDNTTNTPARAEMVTNAPVPQMAVD